MKKFLIVLMFALIGCSAFAESATDYIDYIEYSQDSYKEWAKMVIKYNATQWMDDGDPTWAMFELFCEKYPCTDFYDCEE